jgi:hypothetical protein
VGLEALGADEPVGRGRLHQLIAYARKVYGLAGLLGRVEDSRRKPGTKASLVAAAVLYTGLLRIRSFNALEPRLREKAFLRMVGVQRGRMRLCSVDTLSRALRVTDLESARAVSVAIVQKAERNKVFREGWHGALRYVAIDGWEPFCSRHRHCSHCLVRQVRVKQGDDSVVEVPEYYHRFAAAMLIDKRFDLLLDFEPLLPKDLRPIAPKAAKGKTHTVVKADEDEGELTAAARLIKRVKQTFPWLDVVVADALYANGPFLTTVMKLDLRFRQWGGARGPRGQGVGDGCSAWRVAQLEASGGGASCRPNAWPPPARPRLRAARARQEAARAPRAGRLPTTACRAAYVAGGSHASSGAGGKAQSRGLVS